MNTYLYSSNKIIFEFSLTTVCKRVRIKGSWIIPTWVSGKGRPGNYCRVRIAQIPSRGSATPADIKSLDSPHRVTTLWDNFIAIGAIYFKGYSVNLFYPDIAIAELTLFVFRYVLLFGITERPYLVALNTF